MPTDFSPDIDRYFSRLKSTLDLVSREELSSFMGLLLEALNAGKRIYIMGNGGSAATASHFVCDFNKGLSYGKARRFKFICLSDNVPTTSAYANDVDYECVFVEQLRNFLEPGDLVIGLSGSGNSPNVLRAIEYARSAGATTVGITGFDGGKLKAAAEYGVNVPVDNMQISEDIHMVLDHLIYAVFAKLLPEEKQ
jgi:D-sedoheptulose 7-phosphate isomerase